MPQLPYSIELHDSDLSRIVQKEKAVHVYLTPAYIHRDGKGWTQDVEIIINEATVKGAEVEFPSLLDDGYMKTQLGPYHNLLNIPFATEGPVELELELMSGRIITITGSGITHEFKNERLFVEEYPSN